MKKLIFVLIAALGVSCTSYAQLSEKEIKKATKEAQKLVKEARDDMERDDVPDKRHAKQLIDQAMKNPYIQDDYHTWYEAANVYEYFYRQENIKSYNGVYDTVAMYQYLNDWFTYVLKADSLEQIPNAKGKVTEETRKRLVPSVYRDLSNLINGGVFYFNHRQDNKTAYQFFDRYYTLAQSEILSSYMTDDPTWNQYRYNFAYFPALAAYFLQDWDNCIKYARMAQNDDEYGEDATEFICDAYFEMGDTAQWLEALKEGLVKYPTKDYYYNHLLNYYNLKNDMTELEDFANEMIALDPDKALNYFVLGFIAQEGQVKDYDKAIEQYKIAIEKDPKLSDAYNNIGLCIMYQARDFLDANAAVVNNYRSAAAKKVNQEYEDMLRSALPYFQKVREIEPDAVKKWGAPLQQIYYILKMQKEMDEVEARLKENGLL